MEAEGRGKDQDTKTWYFTVQTDPGMISERTNEAE